MIIASDIAYLLQQRLGITVGRSSIALAAGFFAIFFVGHGIGALAIPFYQMTLGIDPFFLGVVLTLPVLCSAVISPWAGAMLERYQTSDIRRRWVIIATGWICAFMFGAMWMAPSNWPGNWVVGYLLVASLIFFVAATFFTISVRCLAYEQTSDSRGIARVMGFTAVFEKLGSILYYWMFPLAQLSIFGSVHKGVQYVGWLVAVVFIGVLATVAGWYGKSPALDRREPVTGPAQAKPTSTALVPGLQKQLNFILLLVGLQYGVVGLCVSVDFYVLVYFMGAGDIAFGATWKGVLSTAFALVGLFTIPVIVKGCERFGKKNLLYVIYGVSAVGGCVKWVIYSPGNQHWLIVDAVLGAWIWTAMSTLIPAMLADLCYANRKVTGEFHDGVVVAKHNWALNLSVVFAFLSSGILLKLIGFDAGQGANQSQYVLSTLRYILVVGSVVFSVLPMLIVRKLAELESSNASNCHIAT